MSPREQVVASFIDLTERLMTLCFLQNVRLLNIRFPGACSCYANTRQTYHQPHMAMT
jgi:hypothetical protein